MGSVGAFSGRQLDGNTFQIEFRGNGYTPRSTVERYLLRRAAEVTVANGFDFFIVVSGNADVRSATLNTPGSYQSTTTGFATVSGQTAFGAATTGTYTPGADHQNHALRRDSANQDVPGRETGRVKRLRCA